MTLRDKLDQQLADLDAQISTETARHQQTLGQLQAKRTVLLQVSGLITPELEAAVQSLQKIGLLLNAL